MVDSITIDQTYSSFDLNVYLVPSAFNTTRISHSDISSLSIFVHQPQNLIRLQPTIPLYIMAPLYFDDRRTNTESVDVTRVICELAVDTLKESLIILMVPRDKPRVNPSPTFSIPVDHSPQTDSLSVRYPFALA